MDGAGKIRTYRYLTSESGAEFETWVDADRHGAKLLPDDAWQITRLVYAAPPSGVLGEALLIVAPDRLSRSDFAQESGGRRKHYERFVIDAIPLEIAGWPGWSAEFVIKNSDGQVLGPIGIHASYETADRAVEMALEHAETSIDAGISFPEMTSRGQG